MRHFLQKLTFFLLLVIGVTVVAKATPQRLPSESATLYGSVLFSDGNFSKSLYTWPKTNTGSPQLAIQGVRAHSAIIENGLYYAYSYDLFEEQATVKIYNLETGGVVNEWTSGDKSYINFGMDRDPVTGTLYGLFKNGFYTDLAVFEFQGAQPVKTRTIKRLGDLEWYGFSISSSGVIYGIAGEYMDTAYLYRINGETGEMTKIGSTSYSPTYRTSSCFDRETDTLYWMVSTETEIDEPAYLTTVNLTTGKATSIYRLPGDEQVGGLAIPGQVSSDESVPGACMDVNISFGLTSLTGNLTLTTPAKHKDGSPGSGNLEIVVNANNEEITRQSAGWNEYITIPVTVPSPGSYSFSVYAENAAGKGDITTLPARFVGPDAPKPTVASLVYENDIMKVSWQPVTESVNGGWIDADQITYNVTRYPGAVEVAAGLESIVFTEAFPEPDENMTVFYEVTAYHASVASAPAKTNEISLGSIVPAYTSDFANTGLNGYTVIDVYKDGKKWHLMENDGITEVGIEWNDWLEMDDWLITPAFRLEAGKTYEVKAKVRSLHPSFPERIEIKYGSDATLDAMKEGLTVVPAYEVDSQTPVEITGTVIPEEDGKYYIGFHGMSDADCHTLILREYSISAGQSVPAPSPVSDFRITPASDYSLTAEISFTAPDKDIYGNSLPSLSKIEIYRDGELAKTVTDAVPGEKVTVTDYVAYPDTYTYIVYAYNEQGKSVETKGSAYIGAPIPGAPKNVTIRRTDVVGVVRLSWETVTEDENGRPMNPGAVTYGIGIPGASDWQIVIEDITTNVCELKMCDDDDQVFTQLAVFACTDAGYGRGTTAPMIPVGKPYEEVYEDFADGELNYIWGVDERLGGRWDIMDISSSYPLADDNNYAIAMYGSNGDVSADLYSGLIDLSVMKHPGMSFKVYNQSTSLNGANQNEVIISVKDSESDRYIPVMHKTIQELALTQRWGTVEVDLSDYADKTVQVMISVIVKQYMTNLFDDIFIGSLNVELPVPRNLTGNAEGTNVSLTWDAPDFEKSNYYTSQHLLGYKVYRNNTARHDGNLNSSNFKDETVEYDTEYVYHVTAIYEDGESAPSNEYKTSLSGIDLIEGNVTVMSAEGAIVIGNAEGMDVLVSTLDGRVIYHGEGALKTVLNVDKGIYIVTAGHKKASLQVR